MLHRVLTSTVSMNYSSMCVFYDAISRVIDASNGVISQGINVQDILKLKVRVFTIYFVFD